jgi:hypothetical protein
MKRVTKTSAIVYAVHQKTKTQGNRPHPEDCDYQWPNAYSTLEKAQKAINAAVQFKHAYDPCECPSIDPISEKERDFWRCFFTTAVSGCNQETVVQHWGWTFAPINGSVTEDESNGQYVRIITEYEIIPLPVK